MDAQFDKEYSEAHKALVAAREVVAFGDLDLADWFYLHDRN